MWHPKKSQKTKPCEVCGKITTGLKYCKEHAEAKKKSYMKNYYAMKVEKSNPKKAVVEKFVITNKAPFTWDEANDKCFG